ncbi:probable palmitoyltransferase ZDHHC24 [Drosophila biarmipes]|uniref:probable palmitoyltransferase ZDHHC24 n=1 Tax=Drosophila biarmipes TaxID=125945 RepID=UPI0007E66031|nr:probable palmitoyltransferase ZDHHC24 [Drosophila biarmipes]
MENTVESLRLRAKMDSPDQRGGVSMPKRIVKRIKPWADTIAVSMNVSMTLFFYFFDVFYVMPQFLGIFGQAVHFVVSTWIAYNILGNLRACTRTLNSVDTLPPEVLKPAEGEESLWHYCDPCQRTVPPRSWHCKTCSTCILKRDHHCNFVGNCVGHNNQRYFMWFSFYAMIGSALALYDNLLYAHKHGFEFVNLFTMHYLLFVEYLHPGTFDLLWEILIRFILTMNVFAIVFPGVLFISQLVVVRNNSVMYKTADCTYDLGIWNNFGQVLGRRRFWTCLSPDIKSPLSHNGTQWESKGTV